MQRVNFEFLYDLRAKAKAGEGGMLLVLQFCMNMGIIASEYECPVCKTGMKLAARPKVNDGFEWVCRAKKPLYHNVRRSVRSGSWFASSRLSICDILLMTECFVRERSQKDIKFDLKLGSETVCYWRSFFREACVSMFSHETDMIGGVNEIVEIGEIELRKRKYVKNKQVDGKWVLGGMQRGSNRCFLRLLDNKDKHSLLNIIKTSVLPGSTILSDCWKSYDTLNDEDFQDLTVNHSLLFIKPETGEHGDFMEEAWLERKRSIKGRTVTDQIVSYVGECLWRRHHSAHDLMTVFLDGIKRVYPPNSKDPLQIPPNISTAHSNPASSQFSSSPNNGNDKIVVKSEPLSPGDAQPEPGQEMQEDFKCFDEMPAMLSNCHSSPFSEMKEDFKCIDEMSAIMFDSNPSRCSGCKLSGDSLNIESEQVVVKREQVVVKRETSPGAVDVEASQGFSHLNGGEEETDMKFLTVKEEKKREVGNKDSICSTTEGYQCDMKQRLAASLSQLEYKAKCFQCHHCAYTTRWKSNLKQHIDSVHLNLKPFKCSNCHLIFSQKSSLKRHLKRHLNSVHLKSRPFKCSDCALTFTYKSALRKHVNSFHSKARPFRCSGCNHTSIYKSSLKQHIVSVHLKRRSFKCPHCDRTFSTKTLLKCHFDIIHDKRECFDCPHCTYTTDVKSHLQQHINSVHLKLRSFKCSECGRRFSEESHLKQHMDSVHYISRPFQCPHCHHASVKNSHLKRHINIVHFKLKPF